MKTPSSIELSRHVAVMARTGTGRTILRRADLVALVAAPRDAGGGGWQ